MKRKRYRNNKKQRYNTDASEFTPTWKALFEKNLCSGCRKRKEYYDIQHQLDDEEESEMAAQNVILEQKEKLAEIARKAEREKN